MSDQQESKYAPITGKIPGVKQSLGGHEFTIPPLNLDGIQEIEPHLEKIGKWGRDTPLKKQLAEALPIILVAMHRNYPDMTKKDLSALVDLGNFQEVLAAVVSISGFKQAPPGEEDPASP